MNQHQIKREARFHASLGLETLLSEGWNSLDRTYGKNADKVRDAINGVVVELRRRGGRA